MPCPPTCTMRSDSLSKAEVASSNSKTLGFFAKARAMATRCRWPPDRVPPSARRWVSHSVGCDCAIVTVFCYITQLLPTGHHLSWPTCPPPPINNLLYPLFSCLNPWVFFDIFFPYGSWWHLPPSHHPLRHLRCPGRCPGARAAPSASPRSAPGAQPRWPPRRWWRRPPCPVGGPNGATGGGNTWQVGAFRNGHLKAKVGPKEST